jgi:hypothetical protein
MSNFGDVCTPESSNARKYINRDLPARTFPRWGSGSSDWIPSLFSDSWWTMGLSCKEGDVRSRHSCKDHHSLGEVWTAPAKSGLQSSFAPCKVWNPSQLLKSWLNLAKKIIIVDMVGCSSHGWGRWMIASSSAQPKLFNKSVRDVVQGRAFSVLLYEQGFCIR